MQKALDKAHNWSKTFGLTFCPKKTMVAIFHHRERHHKMEPLLLDGKPLYLIDQKPEDKDKEPEDRETIRYLGIELDTKLSFKAHIIKKIRKCKGQMGCLASKATATYGPQPRLTKYGYTGVVIPSLTYGCHVWAHKMTETIKNEMNSLQHNAFPKHPHRGHGNNTQPQAPSTSHLRPRPGYKDKDHNPAKMERHRLKEKI